MPRKYKIIIEFTKTSFFRLKINNSNICTILLDESITSRFCDPIIPNGYFSRIFSFNDDHITFLPQKYKQLLFDLEKNGYSEEIYKDSILEFIKLYFCY